MGNVFGRFGGVKPRYSDPTVQMLFDYEEHYMRLMKSYRHEIEFINDTHTTHTREIKDFYANDLPAIIYRRPHDKKIEEFNAVSREKKFRRRRSMNDNREIFVLVNFIEITRECRRQLVEDVLSATPTSSASCTKKK